MVFGPQTESLVMKNLTLILSIVSFVSLVAPAQNFTLTGNQRLDLLGSQFSDTDNITTFLTAGTPAGVGDEVYEWNELYQEFTLFNFNGSVWNLYEPTVPLGSAFFYRRVGTGATVMRSPGSLPALALVTLNANAYSALSRQSPGPANYHDLIGEPTTSTTPPLNRTFVWHWSPALGDFDIVYRYTTSGGWNKLPVNLPLTVATSGADPQIPPGEGGFVGYFTGGAAPTIQSAHVTGANGTCAPEMILTVTFTTDVDPIEAANPGNYGIFLATSGCTTPGSPGGYVNSVSFPAPLPYGAPPGLRTVQLHLILNPAVCYIVTAPGVTSMSGMPPSVTDPGKSFTPNIGCVAPNDTPDTAQVLSGTAGATQTVPGSLCCATPTDNAVNNLSAYPSKNSKNQKDVWYKYTPDAPGCITVDTCTPAATYPARTVLAIYRGVPKSLVPIEIHQHYATPPRCDNVYWQNDLGSAHDGIPAVPSCPNDLSNPHGPFVFPVQACHDYYIRVAVAGGSLPGNFILKVTHTLKPVLFDECQSSPQQHPTQNGSTFFDNYFATSSTIPDSTIPNDVWVRLGPLPMTTPSGNMVTLNICRSTFTTLQLAVYKYSSGSCPGDPLTTATANTGSICPPNSVTFPGEAGKAYYIRIGSSVRGCGFLELSSSIPLPNTPPPCRSIGSTKQNVYRLIGTAAAIPTSWSWSLTASPGCMNISDQNVDISTINPFDAAFKIATAFAKSINDAAVNSCTPPIAVAVNTASPDVAYLKVRTACDIQQVVLKVGMATFPANCEVNGSAFVAAGSAPLAPCVFNPSIAEITADPEEFEDCNSNGVPDFLDILMGESIDLDSDGVPDECQSCVGAVIASESGSTNAVVGGSVELRVQALGTPPFSYQWSKSGVTLPGKTNSTLVLTNLTLTDTAFYQVTVTNVCGEAQSDDTLVVVTSVPLYPSRPSFSQIKRLGDGRIVLTVTNSSSSAFTVLASPDITLPSAQWSAVGMPTQISPGVFQFTDGNATNYQQRYYQLRWP
jgi:hypothetical protein